MLLRLDLIYLPQELLITQLHFFFLFVGFDELAQLFQFCLLDFLHLLHEEHDDDEYDEED